MAVDLDVAKLEQELQGIYQERQAVRSWLQKRPDVAAWTSKTRLVDQLITPISSHVWKRR